MIACPFAASSPAGTLAARIADTFHVGQVTQYLVPGEAQYPGTATGEHYPARFVELRSGLTVPFRGAVFLVGAGALGKIYCHWIKERGGIALDIGSMCDAWADVGRLRKSCHRLEMYAETPPLTREAAVRHYNAMITRDGLRLDPLPVGLSGTSRSGEPRATVASSLRTAASPTATAHHPGRVSVCSGGVHLPASTLCRPPGTTHAFIAHVGPTCAIRGPGGGSVEYRPMNFSDLRFWILLLVSMTKTGHFLAVQSCRASLHQPDAFLQRGRPLACPPAQRIAAYFLADRVGAAGRKPRAERVPRHAGVATPRHPRLLQIFALLFPRPVRPHLVRWRAYSPGQLGFYAPSDPIPVLFSLGFALIFVAVEYRFHDRLNPLRSAVGLARFAPAGFSLGPVYRR